MRTYIPLFLKDYVCLFDKRIMLRFIFKSLFTRNVHSAEVNWRPK
jgi:hypothetical protein